MSSLNKVILIGRVVNQPDLRYTPQGTPLCKFALAVDRRRGGNQQEKETDFFDIVTWQKLAEICNEYLVKGKLICVTGRIQTRTYETQDGQKRKAFDIVADDMQMLSSRNEDGGAGGAGGARQPQRETAKVGTQANGGGGFDSGGFGPDDIGMDDVPF